MSTLKTPFRYDFVGSFLRPEKLKAAKKAFEEGTCDYRWGIQKKILASGFYVGI